MKILRLHERDQRFSFKWLGECYELNKMEQLFKMEEWGILYWQIIVRHGTIWEDSNFLELRLMRQRDEEPESRNVSSFVKFAEKSEYERKNSENSRASHEKNFIVKSKKYEIFNIVHT